MSWFSNRVSTTAAGVAVVFLVIVLIIVWTSISAPNVVQNNGDYRNFNDTELNVPYQLVKGQTQHIVDGAALQYRPSVRPVTDDFEAFPDDTITQGIIDRNDTNWSNDILPPRQDGIIEYVIPLKISENQYEDPPDASSVGKRHHSGNFRLPISEVWDPHPQYDFTAFGRKFRLRLKHDSSFVDPDVKVTHVRKNETYREHPKHQSRCFYNGDVENDTSSVVSVSLCYGMTGHIKTSNGSYIIKPVDKWSAENERMLKHEFYRDFKNGANNTDSEASRGGCGVANFENTEVPVPPREESSQGKLEEKSDGHRERRSSGGNIYWDHSKENRADRNRLVQFVLPTERWLYPDHSRARYNQWDQHRIYKTHNKPWMMNTTAWRHRRTLSREYFVELMIVVDQSMILEHGDGLLHYILVLMNSVSRIFKHPTIENPISIAVIKIMEVDYYFGPKDSQALGISSSEMLRNFCNWQITHNPHEPSPEHHDLALLLTRETLCKNVSINRCETLGMAPVGKACSPAESCAIVHDYGLGTAVTIAHEIGHVLGMLHDDDPKCAKFKMRQPDWAMMAQRLGQGGHEEWSECSRHYVTEFLETANCLRDEPDNMIPRDEKRLPGEDYSGNKQCELIYGPGSKVCYRNESDVCKVLWCTDPENDCRTWHRPWADGTPCGDDPSQLKWCEKGECVFVKSREPVDGQWGEWGPWGNCSRSCGGGIQKKLRVCNRPSPQNNGNFCVGERVKYRSCSTQDCPPDAPDFRQQQCSQYDHNSMDIPGLTDSRNITWQVKHIGIPRNDRCRLYCQVESKQYYDLRAKVIDGTPCSPDSYDICVNGQCLPAGCDHVLNSTAELDLCGVCRGDNSTCQKITGFHNSSVYGYTRVVKIPAGSKNIDIRQKGWRGCSNDSNYLALKIGDSTRYVLNGKSVMMGKVIEEPGVTIEYSGPETPVERLNSSGTINVDLIVEVLSVGTIDPAEISYEFTVPKSILKYYDWILKDWSYCNPICQGFSYKRAQCVNIHTKEEVADDYCRPKRKEKPEGHSRSCNNYCTLMWQVTERSECSNHCGPGNRTISTQCVKISENVAGAEPLEAAACSHIKRPATYEPCAGPCEAVHWSYSEWQPCSATCGDGTQSRTATCVNNLGKPVPKEMCLAKEKILVRMCANQICPKWHIGEWSACSVSCGVGERRRINVCRIENQAVHADKCSGPRPDDREICTAGLCHRWDTSEWNTCDTKCGEGRKYRQVRCRNSQGVMVSDEKCNLEKKPRHAKRCHRSNCGSSSITTFNEIDTSGEKTRCRWRVSNWNKCSAECGDGMQRRSVICHHVNRFGWVDPKQTNCCLPDKRPNEYRPCKLRECSDEHFWSTGNWKKCSHPCGRKGRQVRRIFCVDAYGKKTRRELCPSKFKPKRVRKCNQRRCGPRTCGELKKRLQTMNDGEYSLVIGGKGMRIYCHKTATDTPREYLTLPSSDRRNYAEIYDKRLLNPYQCPYHGRRNSSCDCVSDTHGNSGFTNFKRIRIDPIKLMIIPDDFTFSRSKGAKQPYGHAGDCYSQINCPQGRFSIDLTGTPLRLSSDVAWGPKGTRAKVIISRPNDQRVMGRCGGYCGYCGPIDGLKLDILPP